MLSSVNGCTSEISIEVERRTRRASFIVHCSSKCIESMTLCEPSAMRSFQEYCKICNAISVFIPSLLYS